MQSNEVLVSAAKAGDDGALTELLVRFEPVVKLRVLAYFNLENDREDMFQEGMIALLSAIRHFDSAQGVKFRTFAGVCIDNRFKSIVSNEKRFGTVSFSEISDEQIDDSDYANPEDRMIDNEQFKKFKDIAKENLSAFENRVFSLYIAGFSYESMAKILDKSQKSIDNAVCRIKRKLHGTFRE